MAANDWSSLDMDLRSVPLVSQFRNGYLKTAFSKLKECHGLSTTVHRVFLNSTFMYLCCFVTWLDGVS